MISPELRLLKEDLDSSIESVLSLNASNHFQIKLKSLLNVAIYIKATRFLEAASKYTLYSCCTFRGDDQNKLDDVSNRLKNFNNPEYTNIRNLFLNELNYDIENGRRLGFYKEKDISLLNEIVRNRHRNVHAKETSIEWFNSNQKDLTDFNKEYQGLLHIISFMEEIRWNSSDFRFLPE
jgi:hypothetical protein